MPTLGTRSLTSARVCFLAVLAAVGFPLAEQFHPLFGGAIDVPSYIAFQQTPLQTFWPLVVLAIATIEVGSVFSFASPFAGGEPWAIRQDHQPGNLGWDPLSLKPTDESAWMTMQTRYPAGTWRVMR